MKVNRGGFPGKDRSKSQIHHMGTFNRSKSNILFLKSHKLNFRRASSFLTKHTDSMMNKDPANSCLHCIISS
jgi:hypothetical protein